MIECKGDSKGIFLSLYGGVGNCAKVAGEMNFDTVIIDLDHDASNDLAKSAVHSEVFTFIQQYGDKIRGIGLEPVCATWSRARRAPIGSQYPSAVRSPGEYIWGFPHLVGRELEKTQDGNRMVRNSIKLVRLAISLGIPGYLENPQTSIMFHVPGIKQLLKRGKVFMAVCHMCQYKVPWKKPTTFMIWGIPKDTVKLHKCTGVGRCTASGKKHLQLSGAGKAGFLTRAAQAYPLALSRHLMPQILN